ncbi:MAG: hypothetical protein JSW64_00760 [Candidatus Zixiibacteriota bacterium]|nr:MAG: hypothetical protein JSW64_00760 [candidate division Zixibacteria bacterium]
MFRLAIFIFVSMLTTGLSANPEEEKLTKYERMTGVRLPTYGFQAIRDSTENQEIDSLVLEKSKSLVPEDYSKEEFSKYFEIVRRYQFADLPCVKRYYIKIPGGWPYNKGVLFNVCDSSYYLEDGELDDFSRVMSNFLAENLSNENVMDIVYFYLRTVYGGGPLHILNSPNEVDKIVKTILYEMYPDTSGDTLHPDYLFRANAERALEKVKKNFKPLKIKNIDNGFEIEFCTFQWFKVEFWKFRITHTSMEIITRKDVAVFIPYLDISE